MLNSKQELCIEMMASGQYTQKQIAKEIGVTETTICNWKKTEEFTERHSAVVKERLAYIAPEALKTMMSLLKSKNEQMRYLSAKDILDRAGYKADKNVNVTGLSKVVIMDDCDQ